MAGMTRQLLEACEAACAEDFGEPMDIVMVAIRRRHSDAIASTSKGEEVDIETRMFCPHRMPPVLAYEILRVASQASPGLHVAGGSGKVPNAKRN